MKKQKLLSLILLGLLSIGNAWGDVTYHSITPNIDGTQYETYHLYNKASGNANSVITGYSSSTITWGTGFNTWVEASGIQGLNSSNYTMPTGVTGWHATSNSCINVRAHTITFHVTNCVEVAFISKSGGNSRTTSLSVKLNGSEVGTVATNGNSVAEVVYGTALQSDKKYDITLSSSDNSNNSQLYQIRFKAPATAPSSPGFSPNGGSVNGNTSVSLTGTATTFYYQWSTNDNAGLTTSSSGWSTGSTATVPNVADTYFLYAYASNGAGLNSDVVRSNAFSVTKVKDPAGLVYETTAITKYSDAANFTNTLTNPHSLSINYLSSNTSVATIASNGEVDIVGAGTTTITASSEATSEYNAGEATYTIKVVTALTTETSRTWTLSSSSEFTDAKSSDKTYSEETNVNNILIGNGATLTKSDQRLKLNNSGTTSGYYVKIKVAAHSKITVSAKGGTSRKIRFDENEVGGTKLLELDCGSTQADKVLPNSGESAKTICIYNSESGNITLYSIKVEPIVPVAITAATWASFSSASALDFTGTDVTAYIAKAKDATHVTLSQINKVPAETGIVVYAESAGTYAIPVLSGDADATTGNLLKPNLSAYELPATEGTDPVYYNYTLAVDGDKNPIFKRSTGVGELAAGKAYLQSSVYAAAPSIFRDVNEENNATNIEDLDANEKVTKFIQNGQFFIMRDGVTYDALGRVVR